MSKLFDDAPGDAARMKMREPCRGCGHEYGRIEEKGAQDCVFCLDCGRFCYNAPRTETGKKVRTVQTTHELIKPKQRIRVIERANARCEICGKGPPGCTLHVGHIISVAQAMSLGMQDTEINADENLLCLCDECNLGMGAGVVPVRMVVRLFAVRATREAGK